MAEKAQRVICSSSWFFCHCSFKVSLSKETWIHSSFHFSVTFPVWWCTV